MNLVALKSKLDARFTDEYDTRVVSGDFFNDGLPRYQVVRLGDTRIVEVYAVRPDTTLDLIYKGPWRYTIV